MTPDPGLLKESQTGSRSRTCFLPAAGTSGCPKSFPALFSSRENVLVLDIFFEALNYETVEQKKAYEVSELLGVCAQGPTQGTQESGEVWAGQVALS